MPVVSCSMWKTITPQDPALFGERFDGLVSVLEDEEGRRMAEEELRQRRVRLVTVSRQVIVYYGAGGGHECV